MYSMLIKTFCNRISKVVPICFRSVPEYENSDMVIMAETTGEVLSLEEQALRRKERLKNLKRKAAPSQQQDTTATSNDDEKSSLPKPKFRSYKPEHEELQTAVLGDAKPADVQEEVKDLLEAANEKVVLEELDISSLAPRKPDWDLKRDVAKKMEKLERRTQKAIAELIWERLRQGETDNIGAIVTMSENRPADDD